METLLSCLKNGQTQNLLWVLSHRVDGQDIHISFLLFDTREGIVHGSRSYRTHTAFDDTADLLDDLWAGILDSVSIPVSICNSIIKNNHAG